MCKFLSVISDGKGKAYYFDYKIRKRILAGKLKYELDSHTSIADYYGFKGAQEDKMNKYEYNPLTRYFEIDQLNTTDDSQEIKEFCEKLNFKNIVPELNIKPIVNPFKDKSCVKVTKKDIALLKKWASVGASVGASVWNSVWASVGGSVRASVRDSVWDSVGDSVRASVGDSVGAYISSFVNLPKWKYIKHKKGVNPFQSCIDLWEKGLVPSYNGTTWRLHGKGGKILYEIKKEKLTGFKKGVKDV